MFFYTGHFVCPVQGVYSYRMSGVRLYCITVISVVFQGSHNIVYPALEDKDKLLNGGFYRDGKVEEKENQKLDSMSGTQLRPKKLGRFV